MNTNNLSSLIKGWEIELDNMYAGGGQDASVLGEGLFARWQILHRMQIGRIPVALGGSLIFQNNRFNERLSGINLELDTERLLQQYRDKLRKAAYQQSFSELPGRTKELLHTQALLETYQNVIRSDSFQTHKIALLRALKDSTALKIRSLRDSIELDSLKQKYAGLKKIEHRADSIFNVQLKRADELKAAVKTWEERWDQKERELEELAQRPGQFKDSLGLAAKTKGQSILSSIRHFKLGTFRLNDNPYTISNVPLRGISLAMQRGRYYYSFSYGQEARQNPRLPDYVRNIRLSGAGRKVMLIKAGIGAPGDSHLHLSFANIRTSQSDSMVAERRNVVVTLESRYTILEQGFIEVTGGVSNAGVTASQSTGELLKGLYGSKEKKANTAASLRFGWQSSKKSTEISLGVQSISPEFSTLGNPFLIANRNTLQVEARQQFWKNKAHIKLLYQKGLPFGATDVTPASRLDQVFGELSCQIGKRGSRAWASYSPGFYLTQGAGSSPAATQINQASAGIQVVFKSSAATQWVSMLQIMNYNDYTQYGDTATTTGLWYYLLTHTLNSGRYSCTALANLGLDHRQSPALRDVNGEVNQSFQVGKWQIQQGTHLVRRFYAAHWYAGASAGIKLDTSKRLRLGINFTYLYNLNSENNNQYFINTSMSWQF